MAQEDTVEEGYQELFFFFLNLFCLANKRWREEEEKRKKIVEIKKHTFSEL